MEQVDDLLLENFYITNDNSIATARDTENNGIELINVTRISKDGIGNTIQRAGKFYFTAEAFDYGEAELTRIVHMVLIELVGEVNTIIIGNDHLPEQAQAVIDKFTKQGLLEPTGDNTFTLQSNNIKKSTGSSPDASYTARYKHGHLDKTLIKQFDDLLSQPFHGHAWGNKDTATTNNRHIINQRYPIDNTLITKAADLHAKVFGGKRWQSLESAILKRANTYGKNIGDYIRPRIVLFSYLNNLSEPWPAGEKLAAGLIENIAKRGVRAYLRYFDLTSKSVVTFLKNRPPLFNIICKAYINYYLNWQINDVIDTIKVSEQASETDHQHANPERTKAMLQDSLNKLQDRINQLNRVPSKHAPLVYASEYIPSVYATAITPEMIYSAIPDEITELLDQASSKPK